MTEEDPVRWECKIQSEIPGRTPFIKTALLVVDEEFITFGDVALRLGEIEEVGYSFVGVKQNPATSTTNFRARAGDTEIKVKHMLRGPRSGYQLFEWLVRLSARAIEPRLAAAACATIRAGGTVEIDSVSISRAGVQGKSSALRKKVTLPWSEVSGTHVDDTGVYVDHIKKGESKAAIAQLRLKPNAPIIPWVVHTLAPEFAAGG
jgi:hypothetical protein